MATSKKTSGGARGAKKRPKITKEQRVAAIKFTGRVTYHDKHHNVPLIIQKLKKATSRGRYVSGPEISNSIYKHHGVKISGSRLRSMLHYIRVNGLIKCLIATGKGYYVTKDTMEIVEYIKSLRRRIRQIGALAVAIDKQGHTVLGRQYSLAKTNQANTKTRKKGNGRKNNHPGGTAKARRTGRNS